MELLRILARHRFVRIGVLMAKSSAGQRIDEIDRSAWGISDELVREYDPALLAGTDLVAVALPSGHAMSIVPELLEAGQAVIDLGGDFRLVDPLVYREFYGREHTSQQLLPESVYGLTELNRSRIAGARLIANPGCYPTSAILPLAPLLRERAIEPEGIAVCSMSGVSGAGRSASTEMSFCEVNESVRAYRVGRHQHLPEIRAALVEAAGVPVSLTFTPHLVPITRGIHTTINARLRPGVDAAAVAAAYERAYGGERFIRLAGDVPPAIKDVTGTNRVDIGWHVDEAGGTVTLLSVLDNMVKGAAGQAVQNMNILFGYEEHEGLR